jgi:hypothetical protein
MTEPPRTRAQIVAEIEAERRQLVTALGRLKRNRREVASKAKRTVPIIGAVVAVGGFFVTSAFLATLRFLWRRVRR